MREMEHRMDTCSANAGSGNKMDGRVNERMNEQMTGPTLIPRVTVPASVWHGLKLGSTRIHPPSHEDNIQFQFPTFISHCGGKGRRRRRLDLKLHGRREEERTRRPSLQAASWLVGWSVCLSRLKSRCYGHPASLAVDSYVYSHIRPQHVHAGMSPPSPKIVAVNDHRYSTRVP